MKTPKDSGFSLLTFLKTSADQSKEDVTGTPTIIQCRTAIYSRVREEIRSDYLSRLSRADTSITQFIQEKSAQYKMEPDAIGAIIKDLIVDIASKARQS